MPQIQGRNTSMVTCELGTVTAGRPPVNPDDLAATLQQLRRIVIPAELAASAHPKVDDARQFLELPFHGPAHVRAENELHGRVGGDGFFQESRVLLEVRVVAHEAHLVAVPREAFVALLVIEEQLEPGGGPALLAEVLFHLRNHVDEFPLVTRLAPPKERCRPFRVNGQVDEWDGRSEEHTSELQSPCNLV